MDEVLDKHKEVGFRKEDLFSVLENLGDNYMTKTELDFLFL